MSSPRLGESWATRLRCTATDEVLPLDRPAFLSAAGRPLFVDYRLDPELGRAWRASLGERPRGLWRYLELLPLEDLEARVDLGEGGTPLLEMSRAAPPGLRVWLKQEAGNPTGSFKDRGLALAVSRARELGAPGVELPSAGNAGISLAAYAARAGLPCRVALPEDTPEPVRRRCRSLGAEVLAGGATLVESAARLGEEPSGFWNLSTLREPYRVEGKKTMGLEIAEQMGWRLPDWIVYPTGGGTGILGMHKAFDELERLGLVKGPRPRFVVVQMGGCAPVVRAWERGREEATPWEEPRTQVWGLRVPRALGDFLILRALRETNGVAVAVEEEEVEPVRHRLVRSEGVTVGPEGAAAWAGLERLAARGEIEPDQRVVVFQTGHPANYGLDG